MIQDPFGIHPAVFKLAPGESITVEVSTNCYRKSLYLTKYCSKQDHSRRSWLDLGNLGLCEQKCSNPFVQLCWKNCNCESYWRVFHCSFQVFLKPLRDRSGFPHAKNPVEKTGIWEHQSPYFTPAGASSPSNFSFLNFLEKKEHFGKKRNKTKKSFIVEQQVQIHHFCCDLSWKRSCGRCALIAATSAFSDVGHILL